MFRSYLLCFLIMLLYPALVMAQVRSERDSAGQKLVSGVSYGRFGLDYTSDRVFAGRKDSLKLPYITPSLAYYHRSGLFARTSVSVLSSGSARIDLTSISGGYLFMKNDFYGGISAAALFYNDSSYSVLAEVAGQMLTYAGYDFGVAEFTLDATVLFSRSADLVTGAELNKTLFLANDKLILMPSVYLVAGTQQYYQEYLDRRSKMMMARRGQNSGGNNNMSSGITVSSSGQFRILAFEFSIPAQYSAGNFRISFTPVYTIPQSPSVINIDDISFKDSLENSFYWSLGVSYKFH